MSDAMKKRKLIKLAVIALATVLAAAGLGQMFRADLFPPYESPSGKTFVYLYPEEQVNAYIRKESGRWNAMLDVMFCGNGPYGDRYSYVYDVFPDGSINSQHYPDKVPPHNLIWDEIQHTNYLPEQNLYVMKWQKGQRWYYDFSEGFCVPGSETEAFLRDTLREIGLSETETADLLALWLPELQGNPYNLLAFLVAHSPLNVSLGEDRGKTLRVFFLTQPLKAPIELEPQTFEPFERDGFTVVQWGGVKIEK